MKKKKNKKIILFCFSKPQKDFNLCNADFLNRKIFFRRLPLSFYFFNIKRVLNFKTRIPFAVAKGYAKFQQQGLNKK